MLILLADEGRGRAGVDQFLVESDAVVRILAMQPTTGSGIDGGEVSRA